ncbi:MAG: PIN domain-containing protein [Planctomycetes bacterium]|nr:PIN domain-containing protein [Planctomycetota bacterium]
MFRHPHYARARAILQSVANRHDEGVISTHSLAETYSVLTSLPLIPRILPLEAQRLLEMNVQAHFRLVSISPSMYLGAIDRCSRQSLSGGRIYDALVLECAREANSDRIYTFNVDDFRRLAADLADRIMAP